MNDEAVVLFMGLLFVLGAVALIITAMNNRRHQREMAHRERVAMIERGLIPSPELNPAAFEAATGLGPTQAPPRGERYRTAGVAMIGIGMALVLLLAGAGNEIRVAFGVGGAWVMLGAAALLNFFLINREPLPPPPRFTPRPLPPREGDNSGN